MSPHYRPMDNLLGYWVIQCQWANIRKIHQSFNDANVEVFINKLNIANSQNITPELEENLIKYSSLSIFLENSLRLRVCIKR